METLASAAVNAKTRMKPLATPIDGLSDASLEKLVAVRIQRSETLEEVALCLFRLLDGGYTVWGDGRLLETRVKVGMLHGLRLEIRVREHAPPHFHVVGGGIDASFGIADCRHLVGAISERDVQLVRLWHASARQRLIETWNATRPTDCPVGPIDA
jgi:hypothetical protein